MTTATVPFLTDAEARALALCREGATPAQAADSTDLHPNRVKELLRQDAIGRARRPVPAAYPDEPATVLPAADRTGRPWPARSEQVLRLLDKYDVTGRALAVPSLPVAKIDRKASKHNQVRLETFVDHEVERYAAAWTAGAVFPPVIVRALGNGRYFLLDGIHRVEAAVRAGVTAVPAILVEDLPDDLATVIAIEANRENGIPLDLASKLAHGTQWVMAKGYTVSRAAAALGLLPSRLEGEVKVAKSERRAQALRPKDWDGLSRAVKARLSAVSNDGPFTVCAELSADADLRLAEVNEIVTELNEAGDHARQEAILAARRAALQERIDSRNAAGKPLKAKAGPREKFMDGIDRISRTLDDPAEVAGMFSGIEAEQAVARLRECRDRLDAAIAGFGPGR